MFHVERAREQSHCGEKLLWKSRPCQPVETKVEERPGYW